MWCDCCTLMYLEKQTFQLYGQCKSLNSSEYACHQRTEPPPPKKVNVTIFQFRPYCGGFWWLILRKSGHWLIVISSAQMTTNFNIITRNKTTTHAFKDQTPPPPSNFKVLYSLQFLTAGRSFVFLLSLRVIHVTECLKSLLLYSCWSIQHRKKCLIYPLKSSTKTEGVHYWHKFELKEKYGGKKLRSYQQNTNKFHGRTRNILSSQFMTPRICL